MAAALGTLPQSLTVLSCTLDVIEPPPVPPPMAPEAPEVYRKPYDVWKAAVIGGVLGGVFLLEVIVLAVGAEHALSAFLIMRRLFNRRCLTAQRCK